MTSRDPLGLTPAQRLQSALSESLPKMAGRQEDLARRQREGRAELRAETPRVELTLDAVIDKLGWSREYAEHFVQPYCTCDDTYDGWIYCEHARDEGVHP